MTCLYCDSPAKKRKMCWKHESRWVRHGDPHYGHDYPTQAECIIDVMETRAYAMYGEVIVDLVLELHPEWTRSSVHTRLVRMPETELFERLGEKLWRLTT